jgi:aspartokinase/homoserine dehydrogenase 1
LAKIVTATVQEQGLSATYVDATEFIVVKPLFGSLFPDLEGTAALVGQKIVPYLQAGEIVVMPGFIGSGPERELVTLGRGGSDLSATVVGHCLKAAAVYLYKEVDGLLTADPRYVPEARIVPELHYREAAELAYYGAKVLHPRTIIPLLTHKIPLTVRSTFRLESPGTRIAGDVQPGLFPVKAITAAMGQSMVSIEGSGMMGVPGIAARTFQALAQKGLSVSMISQASSEASICFVLPDAEASPACEALKEAFQLELNANIIDSISFTSGHAVLAVVGLGMSGTPGMASRTFGALARAEVNITAIAQGSSELNISMVIPEAKVKAGVTALHREFRLEKLRSLPPQHEDDIRFVIHGVGQIGRTLLKQLETQRSYLKDKMHLGLTCIGLADRSGLMLEETGLPSARVEEIVAMKERGAKINGGSSPERLWQLSLKKGIFVDTSATDSTPLIQAALKAGWHVALANKKPLAAPQKVYDELFATARDQGLHLRYEATVGAGLPILDTLAKLADAGDDVKTILGCFSGTLGYLMTSLSDGVAFSEAVRRAHALGYTEPDPREDLSGMDVARKALILARTLGMRLDLSDIHVEPLFDSSLSHDAPTVFLENLKQLDKHWASKIATAKDRHEEIRYVARITRDKVTVGLETVPQSSPLGRLRGTDNQVTITTNRYAQNPLIVSGPGAGAEVTAAGVLNDILAIATAAERNRPMTWSKGGVAS